MEVVFTPARAPRLLRPCCVKRIEILGRERQTPPFPGAMIMNLTEPQMLAVIHAATSTPAKRADERS